MSLAKDYLLEILGDFVYRMRETHHTNPSVLIHVNVNGEIWIFPNYPGTVTPDGVSSKDTGTPEIVCIKVYEHNTLIYGYKSHFVRNQLFGLEKALKIGVVKFMEFLYLRNTGTIQQQQDIYNLDEPGKD